MSGGFLEAFRREISRPEAEISLARAALAMATYKYTDLDFEVYIRKLDAFAEPLKGAGAPASSPRERIAAINRRLFDELGFRGNIEHYADPRNSYLNEVIDWKRGIPITLAAVYLEVAWRLDLPLVPVAFPAHFLVKLSHPREDLVIDPFNRGGMMARADLQALLDGFYGGKSRLEPWMLRGATKSQTVYRMLNNLKLAHTKAHEPADALCVVDMMLALLPDSPIEVRDRGFALHALGHHAEAAAEFRRYLKLAPEAADAPQVRGVLDAVENMAELLR